MICYKRPRRLTVFYKFGLVGECLLNPNRVRPPNDCQNASSDSPSHLRVLPSVCHDGCVWIPQLSWVRERHPGQHSPELPTGRSLNRFSFLSFRAVFTLPPWAMQYCILAAALAHSLPYPQDNLAHDRRQWITALAFIAITITVVLAFPLNIFPCRFTLEFMIWGKDHQSNRLQRFMLTLAICGEAHYVHTCRPIYIHVYACVHHICASRACLDGMVITCGHSIAPVWVHRVAHLHTITCLRLRCSTPSRCSSRGCLIGSCYQCRISG